MRQVAFPTLHRFVDRLALVDFGDVEGKKVRAPRWGFIANADGNFRKNAQHVQLRDHNPGAARHLNGTTHRRRIEPAAAACTSRGGAKLAALLADALADLILLLGNHGAFANAGGVGLHDAKDAVDMARADAEPRAGAAGRGTG